MHNVKVPSKSEHKHSWMYKQISEYPNVCMQNEKELVKIDVFFNETFLFLKLIVPITCKLFYIFTVSTCQ